MKIYLTLLFTLLLFTSCDTREELAVTSFTTEGGKVAATLFSEDFLNPDGIVRRIIMLEENGNSLSEWEIHAAHYSDSVQLKILEGQKLSFLIAEDKTGYSVWDLHSKRVMAESGIGNNGSMAESGTARDYMVHTVLGKKQWVKILGLESEADLRLTNINWQ